MKKTFEIEIYSLAFGGNGVGKIEGKVCFVEGALPGEQVLFEVEKEHPKFIVGKVIERLTDSKDRIEPICPYFGVCGGCQLQYLDYTKELYYKEEQVTDLLSRIGGVKDPKGLKIEASDKEYGYRNTIELHRSREGQYGFYKKKSKEIVSINKCPVSCDAINQRLSVWDSSHKSREVTLKADYLGNVWSSDMMGERFYTDRYRGKDIYLSPKSFSQANRYISERISATLDEWIGKENSKASFFDAYCGVGFFTFLSSSSFSLFAGIDESRVAIECAKTTKKKLSTAKTKFYRGIVEKDFFNIFDQNCSKSNIVFLDPPRKGAGQPFLEKLVKKSKVEKIYYLSCDPARLARDIKIITKSDEFMVTRFKPFDMFPRTMHIETLVELVRK